MACYDIFTGGLGTGLASIANELIDTPLEKAQAQVLKLKAMDPNGAMRRGLSVFACRAYGFYLVTTVILIFMSVWGVGGETCTTVLVGEIETATCQARADIAAARMTDLFTPITASWAGIVSASFGVNGMNSYKGA
jgi:hypothetical protein